jgi:RNA polymerase primary sigma factor
VKSLRLKGARIDALVAQLYDINKRLVGHETRLLRLAESMAWRAKTSHKNYFGSEFDHLWINRVSGLLVLDGKACG